VIGVVVGLGVGVGVLISRCRPRYSASVVVSSSAEGRISLHQARTKYIIAMMYDLSCGHIAAEPKMDRICIKHTLSRPVDHLHVPWDTWATSAWTWCAWTPQRRSL